MLPTEDALWVGEELAAASASRYWQFALTATDANRFAIRLARDVTGRPKILVFNWCYHGTVDETFATLERRRVVGARGNIGPPVDLDETTAWSSGTTSTALERALAHGDVACVLAEPALTNIGIVLPSRATTTRCATLTRGHGTLLVIDETHTLCAGPGGYTRAHGLEPDFLTLGKPIAGGVPAAAYGFSDEVADAGRGARASRRRTSAGSAARSPATRCPWRQCGRRWGGADRRGLRAHDRARRALRARRHASIAAHGCPGT